MSEEKDAIKTLPKKLVLSVTSSLCISHVWLFVVIKTACSLGCVVTYCLCSGLAEYLRLISFNCRSARHGE